MARFLLSRLLQSVLTVFILVSIVFFLVRFTGSPVEFLAGPEATSETKALIAARLGLDQPLWIQYRIFIASMITGDLGDSFLFRAPSASIYFQRLPATVLLALFGMSIAALISLPLGVIAGYRRGSVYDRLAKLLGVIGIATPAFWLGINLIFLFAVFLGWLPVSGMSGFKSFILPGITISLVAIAGLTRLLRSGMIEALGSESVRLVRAKGGSERLVLWKHSLKNASIPVLSFFGVYAANMMGGSIVTETVFAWPGVGYLGYQAMVARDYNLVQTTVLLSGVLVVLVNLATDVVYFYLDPRLRER